MIDYLMMIVVAAAVVVVFALCADALLRYFDREQDDNVDSTFPH